MDHRSTLRLGELGTLGGRVVRAVVALSLLAGGSTVALAAAVAPRLSADTLTPTPVVQRVVAATTPTRATTTPPVLPSSTPEVTAGRVVARPASAALPASAARHLPTLGVYTGPDSKGVAGAAAFGAATGVAPGAVLDFAPAASWTDITAPSWLVAPHARSSARFELSLPMLPDGSQYTLAACASGAYDAQWRRTATNLVGDGLANTIVRPGWEFNGTWYHWSAKNNITGFIGCFQHIVTTMRQVAGQHFSFDWNPDLGRNAFPAEQAYPGDAYVDYVGVDVYDYSWSRYPARSTTEAAAQAAAWNDDLNGDHGLTFWSRFAATHHKPMALTEWAVAARADGHGGGDDPAFVDHIFDFMENPANDVAYAHYFDTNSAANDHALTGARLPASRAEYRRRTLALH